MYPACSVDSGRSTGVGRPTLLNIVLCPPPEKAGEHQIHYLEAGEGLPVVLVHGGAGDCQDWLETIAVLSHSYRVYAPDLPGYGHAPHVRQCDLFNSLLMDFIERK